MSGRRAEWRVCAWPSLARGGVVTGQAALAGLARLMGSDDRVRAPDAAQALGVSCRALAKALRAYGVVPRNVRFGASVAKGYIAADVARERINRHLGNA